MWPFGKKEQREEAVEAPPIAVNPGNRAQAKRAVGRLVALYGKVGKVGWSPEINASLKRYHGLAAAHGIEVPSTLAGAREALALLEAQEAADAATRAAEQLKGNR